MRMVKSGLKGTLLAMALALSLAACTAENAPDAANPSAADGFSAQPLFSVGETYQTASIQINGATPGANICGTPYLSGPNSTFLFQDSLPVGAKVIRAVAIIYGTGCSKNSSTDDMLALTMNGFLLGIAPNPMAVQTCAPVGCDPPMLIASSQMPEGLTNYQYGGNNALLLQSTQFLTAYIQMSLDYTVCGNGVIELGETCDDGNNKSGDGCSSSCQIETGYICPVVNAPCMDIDECTVGNVTCGANASCVNTPGSYHCTCNAGYEGDGTTCAACTTGHYNDVAGGSCKACEDGFYANQEGATSCTPCAEGHMSYPSHIGCIACLSGWYAPGTGNSECLPCPVGQFNTKSGSGSCELCPTGYANNLTGQEQCQPCEAGYFAAQTGSKACEPCGAGTYSSGLANENCTVCPGGTANNSLGQASCPTCPAGTETHFAGAQFCDACPAGKFASEPGTTVCSSCPKGTANSQTGQSACQACAPGFFTNYEGALSCEACGRGEHASGDGNTECQACPEGTANNQLGQGECLNCEAGYESRGKGAFACDACTAGTYAPTAGTNICSACGYGTATNLTGQSACAPCATGTFAASLGQTTCQACPVGSFANTQGLQSCLPCAANTFTNEVGQSSCKACEKGFASAGGAAYCSPVCGDGFVVTGEICDDGNTESNDGCRGDCQKIEDGWECEQEGTPCKRVCIINQVAYTAGDANPENLCQICDPNVTAQAWSNAARGKACTDDTLSCTEDVCNGFGSCVHTLSAGCLIDGGCVAEGAAKADAPCLVCRSLLTANAYSPLPYGSACTDDGQAATLDICNGVGGCTHVAADACQIDGQTVAAGAANPQNPCQWCDPSSSKEAYTPRVAGFACTPDALPCTEDVCDGQGSCAHPLATGCLIDNQCVAKGAPSPQSACMICSPDHGTAAYFSAAYGTPCTDDGLPGTTDICDGQGQCLHETLGTCTIDGVTYQGGASDPQNSCQFCDAQQSATAWSTRDLNFPCADDGLSCTFDACDAHGQCLHRLYIGCLISNGCVAQGAQDPTNDCAVCNFNTNPNGYTAKAAGERCADDGLSTTNDLCNDQGACVHEKNGSCEIDGVSYAAGATNPQNVCQACDATIDPTKWSNRAANVSCTDDNNACTNDVCNSEGTCLHTPITDGACAADGDVDTLDGDDDGTENEAQDQEDADKDSPIDGDTDTAVDGDTDSTADGDSDLDTVVPPSEGSGGGGCQSASGLAPALLLLLVGLALARRRKA